jgi:hypothetical protein
VARRRGSKSNLAQGRKDAKTREKTTGKEKPRVSAAVLETAFPCVFASLREQLFAFSLSTYGYNRIGITTNLLALLAAS